MTVTSGTDTGWIKRPGMVLYRLDRNKYDPAFQLSMKDEIELKVGRHLTFDQDESLVDVATGKPLIEFYGPDFCFVDEGKQSQIAPYLPEGSYVMHLDLAIGFSAMTEFDHY